ncbi:MAG: adenosylcobalamin-dependent ribonucleoside-diphosphate reductase [Candidatus Diapherotrites archaeon]|nr:adenosylcobalamin-dependent ribonucleoside-diphosphate reductase [Candidatus Diapherotrites archaeon]
MGKTFAGLQKRDGRVLEFDESKITEAIWKSAKAVGGQDKKVAEDLTQKVLALLKKQFTADVVPTIEQVQDVVEKVLIESGHAKTAKAYIIYRQQRAELRKEKQKVLEKEDIDEVDKAFDVNALRVLKSRYLRKTEDGKLTETPKQLFTRVATHSALPDVIFDEKIFSLKGGQTVHPTEKCNFKENDEKFSVGKYSLNQFHLEGLKRMYDRHNKKQQMKFSWAEFLTSLEKGEFDKHEKTVEDFYNVMVGKKFMPNTPAIANFGNVLGMGSACFVLDVEDSIEKIMDTLKHAATIFKSGGGLGYNFSKLRPEGDFVSTTSGVASGPLSFMTLFDKMTEVIKQGGIRRGANMGMLNSNHPDIEKFITAKEGNKALTNFNISVLLMPDFWEHYNNNTPYPLRNPRTQEVVKTVNARALFDRIVYQAWESAEPGVIFFDKVNDYNPFYEYLGPIVTTNPCGEVLLYPNEPCNLGSINVWAFVKEDSNGKSFFDWDGLAETTKLCTKLLDNVIDVNNFPLPQIEEMSLNTRKIGLGIMGLGDLLFDLEIPFNTDGGRAFMEQLMEFVAYYSKVESIDLAKARGALPYFEKSFYKDGKLAFAGFYDKASWHFDWQKISDDIKKYGIRNGYTTIIAPTGSISMIAGTSSGMEPVYTLVFEKNVKVGSFYYVDPVFERKMKERGLYDENLMADIVANGGTLQKIGYIPTELKQTFVTAVDTKPEEHIRALAAFQKWVDSSISKTNNFPADATVDDMRASYILAYQLGCKGVTVFRDSSIKGQVLNAPKKKEEEPKPDFKAKVEVTPSIQAVTTTMSKSSPANLHTNTTTGTVTQTQTTYTPLSKLSTDTTTKVIHTGSKYEMKDCPECNTQLQFKEGCVTCLGCGWGLCK